jgi:hypothetical protein
MTSLDSVSKRIRVFGSLQSFSFATRNGNVLASQTTPEYGRSRWDATMENGTYATGTAEPTAGGRTRERRDIGGFV